MYMVWSNCVYVNTLLQKLRLGTLVDGSHSYSCQVQIDLGKWSSHLKSYTTRLMFLSNVVFDKNELHEVNNAFNHLPHFISMTFVSSSKDSPLP